MLRDFCTVTASTKRNVDAGGGRKTAKITHLTSLAITPLWPASEGTIRTLNLNSPREAKECYHVPADGDDLPDVLEGDDLVIAGTTYPIRFVGEWDGVVPDIKTLKIVVTEVKT